MAPGCKYFGLWVFEECYSSVQIGNQSTTVNQLAPQAQFRPRAFEKCSALQQLNFERTEYDPTNRNRSIPEGWEEEEQWTEDAWYDEAEETANVAVLMPLLMSDPLLISSAVMAEGHWWLLDSGASMSVLSASYQSQYRTRQLEAVGTNTRFVAANGSEVVMSSQVAVSVQLEALDNEGRLKSIQVQIEAHVGQTAHNILSTTQLTKRGWLVVLGPDENYLWHEQHGLSISDIIIWEAGSE